MAIPAPSRPQAVLGRDEAVVQHDLAHRRGPQAHLVQAAGHAEPGRPLLDEEGGDAGHLGLAGMRGEDQHHVGDRGVGDVQLGPVEHVAVALALDPGPHAERVGSGVGLGHRVHPDEVPRHQPGQVGLLLRRRAELHQRQLQAPHLRVQREDQPVVVTAVAQGLHDQDRRQDVGAAAAQLGGDRQALDAELGAGAPRLRGELARLLALGQVLVQFPAGEVDRRLLQLLLLRAQREVQPLPLPASRAPRPATLSFAVICTVNISASLSIMSPIRGQQRGQ